MKRILVCTDGSEYAGVCYEYALWAAKRMGTGVNVLYVSDLRQFEIPAIADLSGSLGVQPYQGVVGQLQELEQLKAKLIETYCRRVFVAEGGLPEEEFAFYHETGLLVDSIGVFEERAEIVFLGKRGENANFAKGHLGSMLERVVRASTRPCWITARKFIEPKKIALAFDGGKSGLKALTWLAETPIFKNAEIYVLAVADNLSEKTCLDHLSMAEKQLLDAGRKPRCEMLNGEVETAIANYVEDFGIDMLIAGAYGHSRLRELFIGSTTTELLRSCRIPVLCFR
jgi:nucleotide-binding universal stress UspA family protein